jgi:peptidyl-dipeptidase Dcp
LFKEKGIFDKETANSFKQNVLQAGGSVDPMQTFVKFRGHQPSVNGLLRNRGLLKDDDVKINKPKRD